MISVVISIIVLLISIFLALFYLFSKSNEKIYYGIIIILCFASTIALNYDILGAFNMLQIFLIFLSLSYFLNRFKGNEKSNQLQKIVFIFVIYMVIVTFIGYYFSDYQLIGGIVRNELRPYLQSFQFVCVGFVFLYSLSLTKNQSIKILIYFNRVLIFFAIISILQALVYLVLGVDILPIVRDGTIGGETDTVLSSTGVLRVTGGFGEPKQLAKFMALGLAINLLLYKNLGYKKVNFFIIIVFTCVIILTNSTTGFLSLSIIIILTVFQKMKRNRLYFALLVIVVLLLPILLDKLGVIDKITHLQDGYGVIFGLEDTDSVTLKWLIKEPKYLFTGVGISNVVAYAYPYADNQNLEYILKYVFTMRRGIIKFLAEGGLIGLVMFSLIIFKVYKSAKKDINVKYFCLFMILMVMVISIEAIFEVEMIIFALIYNITYKNKGEKYEYI